MSAANVQHVSSIVFRGPAPWQIGLCGAICLTLLASAAGGRAAEELLPVPVKQPATLVRLFSCGEWSATPSWTFLVCHGLGGLKSGDRFHQLAREIKRCAPKANVLVVDWSPSACLSSHGVPLVWEVAKRIDPVAEATAALLVELAIAPDRATLIGESFGVYVLGRAAAKLGGVERLLAFNPANELGGYAPLDLRTSARQSWSFHTYSIFDTTHEIAHGDFFLETPAQASATQQHTHGIVWLAQRLAAGDQTWLDLQKPLPAAKPRAFRGIARQDGRLDDVVISRVRAQPKDVATTTDAR